MFTTFGSTRARILDPPCPTTRSGSPSLLSSVKGLIKRPLQNHIETPMFSSQALANMSTSKSTHRSKQRSRSREPQSQACSWVPCLRKKSSHRKHVPSMIDYLTLAQLENVWYSQDSCRGFVPANRNTESPEIQQQSQRHPTRRSDELFLPESTSHQPNLWAEGRSFDELVWSRPPSYQP